MNSDDSGLCAALRREELEVLESIYPDYISNNTSGDVLKLDVPVEFGYPRLIDINFPEGYATGSHSVVATDQLVPINIAHLPPILLSVTFPDEYPLKCPPTISSIHSTYSWFPYTIELQRILMKAWSEGEGSLCNWVEYIRNGDMLQDLNLVDSSGVIRIPNQVPHVLVPLLTMYDSTSTRTTFAQNSYACSVCMTSLKGSRCLLLPCSHIFCYSCLRDYWGLCISEGDVHRVGCPDPECVKQGKEADEEEVRMVVSVEEVERWKWLRNKRALEKDPTIIHCPIPICQTPVLKPKTDESSESGWDRLRTCQSCGYSFCSFCKYTWHGPLSACPTSVISAVVLQYLSLPPESSDRLVIERKFGKGVILRLVRQYEEDQSNKKWIESSTMACPGCKVHVEKSLGCNHMTCAKCLQHFCYRCGTRLNPENPYAHFNTPGLKCHLKLFDSQSTEDDWQPVEGFEFE